MPESEVPPPSKRPRHGPATPVLPDDVVIEQILTRVPAAAAVRFRAVCRAWGAALSSGHFVQAYGAAVRSVAQPEIVFFPPAAAGSTTTNFYACKLKLATQQKGSSAAARELVTVNNLRAKDLVLSGTKPCQGLTLLFEPSTSDYHVCNLSTGEHVSLPPRAWAANGEIPYMLSGTGLGFDPAAGEHKVVRLYEDWQNQQQRCEVYGLRSGGWRPCAGQVPPNAAKGLQGRPPVFLDGCFYWHVDAEFNFTGREAILFRTPEPILSLSVGTEQFGWVRPPEERAHQIAHLAELDSCLCAVVDARFTVEQYELWTRLVGTGSSWSLRCRISLASLPRSMRDSLGRGIRMLPLGSWSGGKILLLATSRHEVYAYDPGSNRADRVFSMQDFVEAPPGETGLLLNIALHEESVTGFRHCPAAGWAQLKVKVSSSTVAKREGPADQRRDNFTITPQLVQEMLGMAMAQFHNIANTYN